MLLPEATPPPWRLWRMLERAALHGAPWQRTPAELIVDDATPRATLLAMGDVALLGVGARAPPGSSGRGAALGLRRALRRARARRPAHGQSRSDADPPH